MGPAPHGPPLNEHLVERVQTAVKREHGVEVTAEEVLATQAGDQPPAEFSEQIRQELIAYGFAAG
jgi:hypothetical protein